jgi:hypothetical protein
MIIDRIAEATKISSDYIAYVARSASHRYKVYDVKKKERRASQYSSSIAGT